MVESKMIDLRSLRQEQDKESPQTQGLGFISGCQQVTVAPREASYTSMEFQEAEQKNQKSPLPPFPVQCQEDIVHL